MENLEKKHDETVEGGLYLVGGATVNANGEQIQQAKAAPKFSEMKKPELQLAAKDAGIDFDDKTSIQQLIDLIEKKSLPPTK